MRKLIIIVLFIFIILEGTVVTFPLTLLLTVFLASIWQGQAVIWAFVAGICLDLFAGRLLGGSSLFFLGIILAQERFRKKFHQGWVFYQFVIVVGIITFYSFYFYRYINPWELGIAGIVAALILLWLKNLFGQPGINRKLEV